MKKILITGTTQGIGYHLYQRFLDSYEITTVNRRPFPGKNYICDLSDVRAVESLCEVIKKESYDILINNAGGSIPVWFSDLSCGELVKCTNLNYHAPILLMQAVLNEMKAQSYGRIVNISSIAAKSPRTLIPHYGAAKAAMESFSKSMAVCYADCGITINCVCPGGVETATSIQNRRAMAKLSGKAQEFYNQAMSEGNGLGRMVQQVEVGALVEFFISDTAAAISGQTLNICGTKEVHA